MSKVSSAPRQARPAQTGQPSDVIAVLRARGLLNQMTESGLAEAATAGQLTAYCGFDPSAPSLHVGNLVPVMALAHFQRCGHRPILLVGGGTGMIGDPSGKSTERPLLAAEQVAEYAARIRDQLAGYLDFDGPTPALIMNNADWLNTITLIEYLRDIGKHFSVNMMLAKESVKARLEDREQGISYTEFSYMIVQATDFLHLYDAFGCTVQVGGSDQWGNLIAGVDLIRRVREAHVHALTVPLITSATGQKFGKSEGNALYLDPAMTTPYQMYQYWMNVDDRDVGHYLKVFTFLPLEEIAELERRQTASPASRVGQRRLAFEVTKLIHGEATAQEVEESARFLFGQATLTSSSTLSATSTVLINEELSLHDEVHVTKVPARPRARDLTPDVLLHLATAVPTTRVTQAQLAAGLPLLETLVAGGVARSKGAARTLVSQGGLYVNDRRWTDPDQPLTQADALFGRAILLRSGKRTYHLLLADAEA
jgi:tyrosyl-tRNA synthetase